MMIFQVIRKIIKRGESEPEWRHMSQLSIFVRSHFDADDDTSISIQQIMSQIWNIWKVGINFPSRVEMVEIENN